MRENKPAEEVQRKKILIIDDHPFFRITIRRKLEEFGHEVYEAEDGFKGLSRAKEVLPDLIVIDYIMPGKDGLETCREMKKCPELKNVPLVMFTSESVKKVVVEAIKIGVRDFIAKTTGIDIIGAKIQRILETLCS